MKNKITIKIFSVLLLTFVFSSCAYASEVTGNLSSSGISNTQNTNTGGSLSGTIISSSPKSSTGNSNGDGKITGTVTGGASSSVFSNRADQPIPQNVVNNTVASANNNAVIYSQLNLISSDGTALTPLVSNLAFSNSNITSSSLDTKPGELTATLNKPSSSNFDLTASVIDTNVGSWIWILLLVVLIIVTVLYIYNHNNLKKRKYNYTTKRI